MGVTRLLVLFCLFPFLLDRAIPSEAELDFARLLSSSDCATDLLNYRVQEPPLHIVCRFSKRRIELEGVAYSPDSLPLELILH